MLDNPPRNTPSRSGRCAASSASRSRADRRARRRWSRSKNVDASYTGGVKVLDDVSFDIYAGMTVAVVGESGSGKSTTARVITGLSAADRGAGEVQGRGSAPDYRKRTKDQLRQAQMIYQMADTALNPKVRIGEIIGRPAAVLQRPARGDLKAAGRRAARPDRAGAVAVLPPLPAGAVGRPEAAHRHRPGAGGRADVHHLRRGDQRARPAGGRRHPEAAGPAAEGTEPRLHVHHPRPGDGALHRRRGGGDEEGKVVEAGAEGRDVQAAAPRLHRPAAVVGARKWTPTG
jgi:ABC-type oligopeptide transport system ATPase subunit